MAQTGGFNLPNFVKSYREGEQYGMAKAEQKRKQPLVEQLEGLTLKKSQNAVSLQDIQMKAEQDKVRRNKIKDISNMAKYAQSQPDPSAVFDQGLQFYAQEGDQEALNYLGQWENVGGMLASMNPDDVMGATTWSTTPQTVVVGENEDGTDKLALKVYNNRGGSMLTGDTPMTPYQRAASSAAGSVVGKSQGQAATVGSGNVSAIAEQEKKIAEAKVAKDKATESSKAKIKSYQGLENQINDGLSLISEIRNHPGFESAIGAKGASSGYGLFDSPFSGTDAAGTQELIATLSAKNFLAGVKSFKDSGGGGSLSDNEGKQLSAALRSLNTNQSESDFKKALDKIESLLKRTIQQAEIPSGYVKPKDRALLDKFNKLSPEKQQEFRAKATPEQLKRLGL